ncbi:DUF6801 domain-containing protein [Amycolatopsis lexingtonensis]|uniref:DUF6801 domain-containing protein n=1 Tax=Amycolatopsis lexingtonensis TaxID=218822 RepID=UPI003F6E90C3
MRTAVALALVVTGLTAGPAHAATTARTGTLNHSCTYPGIAPLTSTFAGSLTAPDAVSSGSAFTVTGIQLSHVMSPAVRSLFVAAGYDRVQGSYAATITATNAAPAAAPISGTYPDQSITAAGSLTLSAPAAEVTFTAGTPGSIVFGLGSPITESLQFHKKTTDSWVPMQSVCTPRVTDTTFQPGITVF